MSRPIKRTGAIEAAVDALNRDIQLGEYPEGSRLPSEDKLATEYEVSRPVIREALAHLRERGMVETVNGKGTFVRKPSISLISESLTRHIEFNFADTITPEQLYEARALIEVTSCGLAAERITAAELAQLEKLLAAMESPDRDAASHTEADAAFHVSIARATGNPLIPTMLSPIIESVIKGMFVSSSVAAEAIEAGVHDHRRILDALRRGDPEAARRAMSDHLATSRRFFPADWKWARGGGR